MKIQVFLFLGFVAVVSALSAPTPCVNPEVQTVTVSAGTGSYSTEITTTTSSCACINWNNNDTQQDDGPTNCVEGIDGNNVWKLKDHTDGGAAAPYYGLRLDGYFDKPSNKITTFSFDCQGCDVHMDRYNSGSEDQGLHIYGLAYGGEDVGSTYHANKQGWLFIDVWYPDVVSQFEAGRNGGLYVWNQTAYGIFSFTPADGTAGSGVSPLYTNITTDSRPDDLYFRFVNLVRGDDDAGEGWVRPINPDTGVEYAKKGAQDFLFAANCANNRVPLEPIFYEEERANAEECPEIASDVCGPLNRHCAELPNGTPVPYQCGACKSGFTPQDSSHGPNGRCISAA